MSGGGPIQERISEASGAEGEIMALVSRKAKEWEVCMCVGGTINTT